MVGLWGKKLNKRFKLQKSLMNPFEVNVLITKQYKSSARLTFTCSKSAIETLEKV